MMPKVPVIEDGVEFIKINNPLPRKKVLDINPETVVLQYKTREELLAGRRKTGLRLGKLATKYGVTED